jgi:putative flippase GtrA
MQMNLLLTTILAKLGAREQLKKFILVGLINSVLTYLIYVALNLIFDYRISYFISFVSGILLSAYFNGRIVFNTKILPKTVLIYSIFYFISFAISYFLLTLFIENLGISKLFAPIFILIIMVPFNFIFARLILTGNLLNNPKKAALND